MVPQPQVKIFILLLLLLLDISVISADNNYKEGMELSYTSTDHKMIKGRKLLTTELDAMLDYQEPGANPGHEPHKGGGGGGNRSGNP